MFSNHLSTRAKSVLCLVCLCVLGSAIYGNSLHAPWYFDDYPWIVRNLTIRDLDATLSNFFKSSRGVADLTFALNYRIGELSPVGYHAVNIAIHIASSGVLFLVLKRVFVGAVFLPFAGAVVFLSHPIQTQAVTYVIQRHASLCGLFWFLSLLFFIWAREALLEGQAFGSRRHLVYYLLSILSAALAVGTKQNAAMIPVTLAIFDRYFFSRERGGWDRLLVYLIPYLLAPALVTYMQLVKPLSSGSTLQGITGLENTVVPAAGVSSWEYLTTQFEVIWLYVRLLFLPYGQTLDYAYPVSKGLGALKTISGFVGILLLFIAAFFLRRRAQFISFGIVWFFAAIAIEASVFPLDIVFEHRLYVPMVGFVMVVLAVLRAVNSSKAQWSLLLALMLVYSILTVNRNALWADKLAFYEDNVDKSPKNTRVYLELSRLYLEQGELAKAESLLLAGVQEQPFYVNFYNNLGSLYEMQGRSELALDYLTRALDIDPTYEKTYTNIGVLYANQGRWDEAVRMYRRSLVYNARNARTHYNLGVALYRLDDKSGALDAFREAVQLRPDDVDAFYNLGIVAAELDQREEFERALTGVRRLDSGRGAMLLQEAAASGNP